MDLSQEALQVLSEQDQEKLLREGTQYLLTPEALRKHDILTGALELRQFACESCDNVWWKTVPRTKLVSKCRKCMIKYDALHRDKEFGIGRYRCTNCNHSFFSRCEATTERPCFNCDYTVRTPYIHPKFKPVHRQRTPKDPTMSPYQPPKYEVQPRQPTQAPFVTGMSLVPVLGTLSLVPSPLPGPIKKSISVSDSTSGNTGKNVAATHQATHQAPHAVKVKHRKKVINASKVHDSTGSTASTFVTQIERPTYVHITEEFGDDIPVVISDIESDDEDVIVCESSTEFETDSELSSSAAQESDIDYSTTDVESTVGAIGSDSDSEDPDRTKIPHKHGLMPKQVARAEKTHGIIEQQSLYSSAKDSGLGTLSTSVETTTSLLPTSFDGSNLWQGNRT